MSNQCHQCGSYAINHQHHGRDGSEPDLCDVCFWHSRHDQLKEKLSVTTDCADAYSRMFEEVSEDRERVMAERDTLRKQLDEAREFLRYSADECIPSLGREIEDWLEENKV